ncbi:jg21404 [Pararge aegeria aegeria]|uniref:Jg21404 protein n=1 Tax=Pararge aegeria aegeria TaxID=348720 RepID=A0A8S4RZB9_9NEOP|nr:jg21404 [Pararge aegeria aegeria]
MCLCIFLTYSQQPSETTDRGAKQHHVMRITDVIDVDPDEVDCDSARPDSSELHGAAGPEHQKTVVMGTPFKSHISSRGRDVGLHDDDDDDDDDDNDDDDADDDN